MFDGNFPALDIKSFMVVLVVFLALAALITFISGVRSIQESRRLRYYRLRRSRLVAGWRTLFISIVIFGVTFLISQYGEPAIYSFYPVTPTPTIPPTATVIPTITQTSTLTLSPTITPTLSESYTPTPSPTPHVPVAVEVQFSASVTPPADAVFSPLRFAQGIDLAYNPISPATSFTNPISKMYAIFSYDKMVDGVQWTALWYRDGELVYFETKPWDGGTGGFGFSDWEPEPEAWQPGNYQVHIFIGLELKVSGEFTVSGFPPTQTPTPSHTPTPTFSLTPTPTLTPTKTPIPTVTDTRWPTQTPTSSNTPRPPTRTPIPTSTRLPTNTPIPTRTFRPTPTPTVTKTKIPTKTPLSVPGDFFQGATIFPRSNFLMPREWFWVYINAGQFQLLYGRYF
jgi:hypothetical protein